MLFHVIKFSFPFTIASQSVSLSVFSLDDFSCFTIDKQGVCGPGVDRP